MPTFCQPTILSVLKIQFQVPLYSVNCYLITKKAFVEGKRRGESLFFNGTHAFPFAKSYKSLYLPRFFRLEIMPSTSEHSSPGQEALWPQEKLPHREMCLGLHEFTRVLLCLSQFDNALHYLQRLSETISFSQLVSKKEGGEAGYFLTFVEITCKKSIPLII